MTDTELNQRRDELADHLDKTSHLHATMGYTPSKAFIEGFDQAIQLMRTEIKELKQAPFYKTYDTVCSENAKLRSEVKRLHQVITKELTENDDLGCEYTYVSLLKNEIVRLKNGK